MLALKKVSAVFLMICGMAMLFPSLFGVSASARNIVTLNNFAINSQKGTFTPSAKKTNSSNTVINLGNTKRGYVVVADNYAVNGGFVGSTSVYTGHRKEFSDRSGPGGTYHLKLSSPFSDAPKTLRLNGSWSPDAK